MFEIQLRMFRDLLPEDLSSCNRVLINQMGLVSVEAVNPRKDYKLKENSVKSWIFGHTCCGCRCDMNKRSVAVGLG